MSTAEQVQVEAGAEAPAPTPALQPNELERVRAEDPDFPVVLAKARAKARGEAYDPVKHLPRQGRKGIDEVRPEVETGIQEMIDGFLQRAARGRRHLVDIKKAAANDDT